MDRGGGGRKVTGGGIYKVFLNQVFNLNVLYFQS